MLLFNKSQVVKIRFGENRILCVVSCVVLFVQVLQYRLMYLFFVVNVWMLNICGKNRFILCVVVGYFVQDI